MKTCGVEGCTKPYNAKGYCRIHYIRMWMNGTTDKLKQGKPVTYCKVEGCSDRCTGRGYCRYHYTRFMRHGDPLKSRGAKKSYLNKQGYVMQVAPKDHPRINAKGEVLEHVLVMEKMIGRYLTVNETVHHKNGLRDDNRPENLELWASRHPKGQRIPDLIAFAHDILQEYSRQSIPDHWTFAG